ncbi:MAG: glycoside hydrolase family 15 protein [Pyrinomonadaceae bacterium]|nr:glycoside hydrolase family 15 protein [Pyrinomonadaceae bacterium]
MIFAVAVSAQTAAPGGPGKDAQWATAAKQGVGTSATTQSKVWFTLAQGVMTEVYYPDVTVANVHLLQFIVVNPKTKKVETEQDDAIHQIRVTRPDSLTFQQINTAKSGEWKITKTYVTDPETDSVLIDVKFEPKNKGLSLYVFYDPSIGNSGMGDIGSVLSVDDIRETGFDASDETTKIDSTLLFSVPISEQKVEFAESDAAKHILRASEPRSRDWAGPGNVVLSARIEQPRSFTVVLTFDPQPGGIPAEALHSMQKGFSKVRTEYEKGWADYVKTLPRVDAKYQAQFNMAAMQLKAHEDKANPGANIASMSVPWGGGANANDANIGGYHLVWSRDLYQVFTAFMAIGDKAAAGRALDFLFKVQQKPDGSFPQNSWLDGRPFWGSLQMDEVAYPLIMAYELKRFDKATWENHVKKAADFIVKNGPVTPQERWEEEAGYSPSTIAAQIAGLVCAAEIAKRNGDEASATIYLAAADDWARNVERWTATTTGKYGDGNYFLRITQNGNPDAGDKIELNNGAGFFDERDIVDAGFLELVRLGIKRADDPLIMKSLKVIDQIIKVDTPNGPAFYRYNNDGYGEMPDGRRWNWDGKYTGKGRLWVLLSGERGQYDIARCGMRNPEAGKESPAKPQRSNEEKNCLDSARDRLDHMLAFANEGLMIPEQVWDKKETPKNIDKQFIPELKFGEGTGSATPLAWSMAQFIRLATNLKAGRNLDTPDVVYERYKNGVPPQANGFGGMDEEVVIPLKPGATTDAERRVAAGAKVAYGIGGNSQLLTADAGGEAKLSFTMPAEPTVAFVGVIAPDGATAFERVKVIGEPTRQEFLPDAVAKIKAATTSPIIDGDSAIFFHRGKAEMVQVAGDITSWNAGRIFMTKIEDGLFAHRRKFAADARVEYKYVIDGKWELDPLNPNSINNGVGGRNNFIEMPVYRASEDARGEAAKLDEFDIGSNAFGTRRIKAYVPQAYLNSSERLGAIYIQDGSEYASRAAATQVLEALLKERRVRPFILVFIDPKERFKEYFANDAWADFVANEVVPEVDRRYNTIASRDGRATLGASLGGITSLHIGLRHPDKFGRLGGQSSSFWIDNERVVRALEKLDPSVSPFIFYLDDGAFEGVDDSRRVNVMLRGKGYKVTYKEGQTGHNWTAWRDRLSEAFIALMN